MRFVTVQQETEPEVIVTVESCGQRSVRVVATRGLQRQNICTLENGRLTREFLDVEVAASMGIGEFGGEDFETGRMQCTA